MMDLGALGLDEWHRSHAETELAPGQDLARVMAVDRGSMLVRGERGELRAELPGAWSRTASSDDLPCVGDWVCLEPSSESLAIVRGVLPRKTVLRRKAPGRSTEVQLIAANLDVAFIVQACDFDFNLRRLERYLVVARDGGIEPVVVLSKTDLVSPEELASRMEELATCDRSVSVLPISNETGSGLDGLRERLEPARTYCLMGSSGVGKSTLINELLGREELGTRAVSSSGEGVHTTTRRQLIVLDCGALLIDTPGMRELGLIGAGDGLEESFDEIHDLATRCRFSDCTHTKEPGCAVLAALAAGELDEGRYESFVKLRRETEFHELSQAQKRRKDRDFGNFIKSAKKRPKR